MAEIMCIEESFACIYGFGGKCDAMFRLKDGTVAICDFKTQLASDGKFKMYPSWAAQLVAYAVGLGHPEARLINMCFALGPTFAFEVKYWDGQKDIKVSDIVDRMKEEAHHREKDQAEEFLASLKGAEGEGGDLAISNQQVSPRLLWKRGESEEKTFLEVNRGYYENFKLAFGLWCSPLGRGFVPHETIPSCKPLPSWDEIMQLGSQRPLNLGLRPSKELFEAGGADSKSV